MQTEGGETLEAEARRLRDLVYERTVSDQEWETAKAYWMADIKWLRMAVKLGLHNYKRGTYDE